MNRDHEDVDVIEVAGLDEKYRPQFFKPWLVQYADGRIVECDSEDEACEIQRQHREAHGLS